MRNLYNVAIVGATGLVGRKLISVLQARNFPIKELHLFASEKSIGRCIYACGKYRRVKTITKNSFFKIDIAFFCANSDISKEYVEYALESGAFVIDNSSAFRMQSDVPLIVPEVNGEALERYCGKLIANPNCSTIQAVLPLKPLCDEYGIKRIIYTTLQAVSGSGNKGIADLKRCKNGHIAQLYPFNIVKNCIPKIGDYTVFGYTEEEIKMVNETQKILNKKIGVTATCIRVPIENCHGVSVSVELEKPFNDEDIKSTIKSIGGIKIVDLPLEEFANDRNEILVGRIKRSFVFENGLDFYCVGDNTLKGATLNAVQIAEKLISLNKI
jgi:aspartate-semialdehyde dehydrogenase